jgi:hypothetical protein
MKRRVFALCAGLIMLHSVAGSAVAVVAVATLFVVPQATGLVTSTELSGWTVKSGAVPESGVPAISDV